MTGHLITATPATPGFVTDLHMRRHSDPAVCDQCGEPFPCGGAGRQYKDAARFTHPVWLDDRYFQALVKRTAQTKA